MKRVAVVTGAARGIGAATCEALRVDGWEVVGIDALSGGDWIQADCGVAGDLERALSDLPRIDGLVNNAALQHSKPLLETTVAEWDAVLATNLRASFVTMKLCAERLSAGRGAVVNIASVHATATSENVSPYAASKAGLLGLTRAAAIELAPRVRVNAVVPGAVDTPALRDGFARRVDGDPEGSLIARTPLGRIGAPGDVAEAVVFLLDGRRSGFMTGEALVVDGGVLARLASE